MTGLPWAPWLPATWPAPAVQQPLSGDVSQWLRVFSPTVTVNGRGEPALEGEIVRDVATYGAQLAPLTALVLAMIDSQPPPAEAVAKLRAICAEIEAKKLQYREGALGRARAALTELAESDPEGLAAVVREFRTAGG